ncbi:MAG: kelch repeat-containing protein [bacterium]|nr:kelch repeat-containing protein [bacterium]
MKNKLNSKQVVVTTFFLLFMSAFTFSQDFTWKKGSNVNNQTGTYGSIGISAPGNNPGGRSGACSWKDASGNFWLFGGEGRDFIGNNGFLNDLWKYNLSTNEWTWVKGDNIIAQIGVYGSMGVPSLLNKPGSRTSAVSWKDASGNLWMYGGYGYDATVTMGYLSDLWKYDITSNQWTWIKGSNLANQTGNYGTIAVPSAANVPGARRGSSAWADMNGNLWLYGGLGYPGTNTLGRMNDLWKYDISNNQWTWMLGTNAIDQSGSYGTMGTSSPTNKPGGRQMAETWVDNSGNLWMHGGEGFDSGVPFFGNLNDLWRYSISINEWTWVKGGNNINQNGVYGTQGTASPANMPGSRFGGITWTDGIGTMWLFGGKGFPGTGVLTGELNDLWSYNISTNQWTWIKSSSVIDQPGVYGTQGFPGNTNRPGSRHGSVSWIDGSNNLWLFGGSGFPTSGGSGDLNDLWKYTNCFISPITMSIVSKDSTICAGETTSLTASGSNNYLWSQNSITTSFLVIKPNVTTTYTVYTSDANGCVYSTSFTETVSACIGIYENSFDHNKSAIFPNPNNGNFSVRVNNPGEKNQLMVKDLFGLKMIDLELTDAKMNLNFKLEKGIYIYKIVIDGKESQSGKLVVE